MIYKIPCVAVLLTVLLALAGCGAALYESSNWQAPPGDALTTDWDVASAKCEGEAINKEASEEEKRAMLEMTASTGSVLSDIGNNNLSPEADAVLLGLAVAVGIIGGLMPSQMDENAKDDHFARCMKSLGWVER